MAKKVYGKSAKGGKRSDLKRPNVKTLARGAGGNKAKSPQPRAK